ncbi:MAG TPA: ATP synthase F1 subunit delta [Vicinamibacterales bacterium]|nr:ATP synthase F1 subunit delta [Vicinamibacterales bacterium]HOG28899.1 ATP synthase F1 subunit delta [Vicinamibacterales bacterium]HOQ60470.1 ATP synthase F1 subunit delta [Vicinamibacterales bacterium]HPK72673.1 ATP synthase F1 subunit delta [Vicinamibacterales bacterium]HPW21026.1 ATP synthase F1 subunit delta [Vicinamibacterales bacterium]
MTARASAKRYARALLDVALAEADASAVERQLARVSGLFTGHADLWAVMTNPAVPAPKKRAVVEAMLPRLEVAPVVAKLLQLLAGRDRLALLPDIVEAYGNRLLDHRRVVRAVVTSAVPLEAERTKALERELAGITGRTVIVSAETDPAIVGGVVARIGSTVYDGSVRRQLEKIRERLAAAGQ